MTEATSRLPSAIAATIGILFLYLLGKALFGYRAGLLAALALGYLTVDEMSEGTRIAATFEPNPAHRSIYDELFGEFLALYENNKKTYARLNHHG